MIAVLVKATGAEAALEAAAVALGGRRTMAIAGKAIEVVTRKHFRTRNREPNKRGWPRQNFWEKEGARHTALTEIAETSAKVVVASPAIAHKARGGQVKARRGEALAIPLTARAYAAGSPREGAIPTLELFKWRGAKRAFLGV